MTCAACDRQVDVESRLTAFEVRGWERERSAGGTNHLMFRRRTGRVLCGACVTTKQQTGNAQQGSLLGGTA